MTYHLRGWQRLWRMRDFFLLNLMQWLRPGWLFGLKSSVGCIKTFLWKTPREIAPVRLLSQICVNTSLWGKVPELLINGWYWNDLILGGSGEMTNVERKRRVGGGTDKFLHQHLRAPGPPGLWWVHLRLTAAVVIPNYYISFFSV